MHAHTPNPTPPAQPPVAGPVSNGAAPEPSATFEALNLHPDLLRGIRELGFERPTPIQTQAIPHVLAGRDVIGCAQTGTGKTAAFVLPILHRLLQTPGRGNVRALIVAPTRELALQSMDHLKSLSRYVPLKGAAIFGGVPMEPQIRALQQGLDIISATPGRLLDHIYSGRIDFIDLSIFVLDEVDRMLDMGFLPDIQKVLRLLPPRRQNLVFSATLPNEIQVLLQGILHDPVMVQIARSSPVAGVRQALYPVPRHVKADLLMELVRRGGMTSVLVFTRTKIAADRLSRILQERGLKVSVLHGDRSQSQRLRALEQFRKGRSQLMVATDIAARGIDIEDISHVINFDVPHTPEDYIHRIGRTARAEATGDAFTLVDAAEEPLITDIEKVLRKTLPRITLPDFNYQRAGGSTSHPAHHRRGHGQGQGSGHPQGSGGHRPPRHRQGRHGR